jgi:hypothetical protein
MIKPGKAFSQLMEANNTGETKIKVFGKHFQLTFELIARSEFIFYFLKLEECLTLKHA